jgi:hypothetical protein
MKKILLACLPIVVLAMACSNSKVTSSWVDPNTKAPLKKVMVVALMNTKDRPLKQQMEEQFAQELTAQGVSATTSFNSFGPKGFEGMKERQVVNQLRNSNINGIVTIVLLDKNKEQNYVPGNVQYNPQTVYVRRNRFYGYYTTYYDRVYTPGYYETNTNYFFETNVYDVSRNKVLYSAQSESFDPSSIESMADKQSKAVVKDMKKKEIL